MPEFENMGFEPAPIEADGQPLAQAAATPVIRDASHLRSNEVSEIISSRPGFMIRWGISIFFVILLMLVASTFFIHYPDVVPTVARFTSINAPKEVKTKTDGKLIKLLATEGAMVAKDEVLGYMESRATHAAVVTLSKTVDSMQQLLLQNRTESVVGCFTNAERNYSWEGQLGEVQPAYQSFTQGFIVFKQYLASGFYLKKKSMLQNDLNYMQRLRSNLQQQKKIQEQDLVLTQQGLEAQQKLREQDVNSPKELRDEQSRYLSKTMSIPQINASIISNESSQHEKQKEILQLENDIAQQKSVFAQVLSSLKAELDNWKNKYLLTAPIAGKVAFATFLQQDQQIAANQTICYINPENSNYYAAVFIPQSNFGKIKTGQRVLLKLPSYPFQEFGAVEGKLDFISNIPSDSGYMAKVSLPAGLITNYKKPVQYREGLTAMGEIITEDLRLSDRLLNQLKSTFKK
jgi:multidrug efflux pump subunit AcrA (membrane-fusion protein)